MENYRIVETDEVLDIYREGQRSGFIAGVIACIGAKYLYDRRRQLSKKNAEYWKNQK